MNRLLLCCAVCALSLTTLTAFTPKGEAYEYGTRAVRGTNTHDVQQMSIHLDLARYDEVIEQGCSRFQALKHYPAYGVRKTRSPPPPFIVYSSSVPCLLQIDEAFLKKVKVYRDAHQKKRPNSVGGRTLEYFAFKSIAAKMTQLERKQVALAVVAEVRKQRTTFDTLTDTQKKALAPRRAHLAHVMKSLTPYLKRNQEMVAETLAWDIAPKSHAKALTILDRLHAKKRLTTPHGMLLYARLTKTPARSKRYAKRGKSALIKQTKEAERKLKAQSKEEGPKAQ